MRLSFFLAISFLILVDASDEQTAHETHKISKRNRFVMKEKSVVYKDSLEDESSSEQPNPLLNTTIEKRPIEKETVASEEEVSDVESESKRLIQKMKEGVDHINLDEYISGEDDERKATSTPSPSNEMSKASNFEWV